VARRPFYTLDTPSGTSSVVTNAVREGFHAPASRLKPEVDQHRRIVT
jgi:hypothetical protein